ncbi:hypothetical protein AB0945_35795 [Streptomyces sp. NPDC005474]
MAHWILPQLRQVFVRFLARLGPLDLGYVTWGRQERSPGAS